MKNELREIDPKEWKLESWCDLTVGTIFRFFSRSDGTHLDDVTGLIVGRNAYYTGMFHYDVVILGKVMEMTITRGEDHAVLYENDAFFPVNGRISVEGRG